MNSSRFFKILAATCLLAPAAAYSAIISATVDNDKPVENILLDIDVSTSSSPSNLAWNGTGWQAKASYRDLGQVFLATQSASVEAIVFHTASVGANAPEAAFSLSIYQVAGPSNAFPTAAPLYSGTGTLPATMTAGQWLTIALDTPQAITSGNYYAVQISFTDLGDDVKLNLHSGNTDVYRNGRAYLYQNPGANLPREYSSSSGVLGMLVVATIPEAGTTAFLLLGGIAACGLPLGRRLLRPTV